MSFRRLRHLGQPSQHFKYHEDYKKFKIEHGLKYSKFTSILEHMKSGKNVELDHIVTKRYWEVVWKSFWQPLRVWALNKKALRYYGAVAALGLGFTYVSAVRPDLFGLAPKMQYVTPDSVQADFEQIKRDLGMESRNIRLVISREYGSNQFDGFSKPYIYGSASLPRGATICLPSVYFEELEDSKVAPVNVGKTTFDWDTLNGMVVRRKLQLPSDELRFLLASSLVAANENHHIAEHIRAPFLYIAGIFTYYAIVWCGLEHAQPAIYRTRFRRYEAIWTAVLLAYLVRYRQMEKVNNVARCEEKVAAAEPSLGIAGANYLDRMAVIRSSMRAELGTYAGRFISACGDRVYNDYDYLRMVPPEHNLLSRADRLRDTVAERS